MTVGFHAVNFLNKMLDHLRGGTAWTQPSGIYYKLHTGDPGASGTANAAVGDATRKAAVFGAAASGSIANSSAIGPWTNGGTSETLTHISAWDASTSGNFLWSDDLTVSKAWVSGETFTIPIGSATVPFGPLAA